MLGAEISIGDSKCRGIPRTSGEVHLEEMSISMLLTRHPVNRGLHQGEMHVLH